MFWPVFLTAKQSGRSVRIAETVSGVLRLVTAFRLISRCSISNAQANQRSFFRVNTKSAIGLVFPIGLRVFVLLLVLSRRRCSCSNPVVRVDHEHHFIEHKHEFLSRSSRIATSKDACRVKTANLSLAQKDPLTRLAASGSGFTSPDQVTALQRVNLEIADSTRRPPSWLRLLRCRKMAFHKQVFR
jgi:hypothetical protein